MEGIDPRLIEQMARQAREIQEWMKSSGTLDTGQMISRMLADSVITPQTQAAIDSIVASQIQIDAVRDVVSVLTQFTIPQTQLDRVFEVLARTAENIRLFEDSVAGVAIQIEASYSEMVASLSGAHRVFAGRSSAFTVTWDEGDTSDAAEYECGFELPAGNLEESVGDAVVWGDVATAEFVRGVVSATAHEGTEDGADQTIELQTPSLSLGGHSLQVTNTVQQWNVQCWEDSDDVHSFTFKGYGDRAKHVVDWLCMAAKAAMTNTSQLAQVPLEVDVPQEQIADEQKTICEPRMTLPALGYPADQVEGAIEEHRREQQSVRDARLDTKPGESQYLEGAYIEATTELHAGIIRGEPDDVVNLRLLEQVRANIQRQLAQGTAQAGSQGHEGGEHHFVSEAVLDPAHKEQDRLALLASKYSQNGAGKVYPESIALWEEIARLKRIPLTDKLICDRITGLSTSNLRYHKGRMKKTGFWRDCGLLD